MSEEASMGPHLERELAMLAGRAHPDLRVGSRAIQLGDENALTASEAAPLARAIPPVRRASGAARIVARQLLRDAGFGGVVELPRLGSGAPAWPAGFVGSIAHDEAVAVAAVAPAASILGVGIDVKPLLPLPADLLDIVATPSERAQLNGDLTEARLLFCMKEAVYKATHPVDGHFLDHQDVEICLRSHVASTSTGRRLRLYVSRSPRLLALTVLESGAGYGPKGVRR
jgi:4'-phosphopantetheinyl transferase EntD